MFFNTFLIYLYELKNYHYESNLLHRNGHGRTVNIHHTLFTMHEQIISELSARYPELPVSAVVRLLCERRGCVNLKHNAELVLCDCTRSNYIKIVNELFE